MDDGRTWRVGELAGSTGLTVRALHHYDEIGLLRPSSRNGAGHRRYTADDVRRLHRILALRGFGMSLGEIAGVLAGGNDPRELVRRQLAQVEARITVARRLERDLRGVLRALDEAAEPPAATLVDVIEGMVTMQRPLTPEKLQELNEHRRRMTEGLSREELAEMAESRRHHHEQLTPEERAELHRRLRSSTGALFPSDA
ncbi:MerR family transcriptional regulator [Dactylosporangium sp. NPDC048998]|uniref:MerR family transcriptional regulator n=1 Tax=Dactylosporangium sp. NPDC048998 TaxID=3363976 RepID=UPI0037233CAD